MVYARQVRKFLAIAVTSLFVALVSQSGALAAVGDWRVDSVSGAVRVLPMGKRAAAARVGDILGAGDEIETGADSSAILVQGESVITVTANSRMGLP